MKKFLLTAVSVAAVSILGTAGATAAPAPAPAKAQPANVDRAIARGMTLLNTDTFGPWGCEDFVDFAYGRTTKTGIPRDYARSYFEGLKSRGLTHQSLPAPRGALVYSKGQYGYHVDISLGNGKYLSGGVQGLSPGWGNKKNIQIIPAANLGEFTLLGWAPAQWPEPTKAELAASQPPKQDQAKKPANKQVAAPKPSKKQLAAPKP